MHNQMIICALALASTFFLGGCASYWETVRITQECYAENPMPASYEAGKYYGLVGILQAYSVDGAAISQVNDNRTKCVADRKAAAVR